VQARQAQAALKATRAAMSGLNGAQVSGARSASILGASASAAAGHITKMGNQLQWTGRQLMYNWTLPIVASGTVMAKWANENEKAMVRVRKVYGDQNFSATAKGAARANNELAALARNFEALSNRYGVVQSQVINIGADWAAAGASGLALARSTELTLQTMVLGEMDHAKATQSLIAIQAQYQLSSEGLRDVLAQLNAVENQTGTSLDDLIEAFTRTAGVARSAGVTTGELASMIAAIVPAAGSAANGGNALKTIMSRLLAPTKDVVDTLASMNIHVEESGWQSMTATKRLQLLSDKYMQLSDSQRVAASSYVASRWQLNKLDILLRAMASDSSYYAKALEVTSDKSAYLQIAQKELNAVLDSSPQKLKQISVILQNVGAKVIQPLIPIIIGLGNEIAKLATWFSDLPIGVQKTIGYMLLFIATIGPIAKYIGSLGTLIGTLLSGLLRLGGGILFVTGGLQRLIGLPFRLVSAGIVGATGAVARFVASLGGLSKMWAAVVGFMASRWIGLKYLLLAIGNTLVAALVWIPGRGMPRVAAAFKFGFRTLFAGLGAMISRFALGIGVFFMTGLKALPMIIFRFLISPWGVALSAAIGLLVMFRKQIGTVFSRLGADLIAPWTAAMGGFASTAGFFSKFVQFLKNVFWSLPVEVQRAMLAVVRVVQQAAMAVYRLFQYLNPFAHHSPSLVENVTNGMAVIISQFGTLSRIQSPIDKAYANIAKLKKLTANFQASQAASERHDQIRNLAKYAPKAVAVFKELSKEAERLQKQLDSMAGPLAKQQAVVDRLSAALDDANYRLDQQQKILDRLQDAADRYAGIIDAAKQSMSDFASAPLKGMQAMDDAIFDNQMQQKALQLEMMKMKQAGQGYADAASKVADLNGALEMLTGTRTELRDAGAGSEILKTYDDEIKKVNEQKKAVTSQAEVYGNLADQLQALQDQADRLDLEKSLQFDGLTHQLEALANTQKEITFQEAIQGIQAAKDEIAATQPLLDAVNGQIKNQTAIVDQLTAAIQPIQDQYDIQNHQLEVMQSAYDGINATMGDIKTAISDITSQTEAAASAASSAGAGIGKALGKGAGGKEPKLSAAEQAMANAAGSSFPDPGGTSSIGREGKGFDQSADIDKFTQDIAKQTGDIWSSVDLLGPLKKKWDGVKNWFGTQIQPAFAPVKDYVGSLFEGVDWLAPLKKGSAVGNLLGSIGDEFKKVPQYAKQAWDFLKTLFGDDFKKLFTDTWAALKDAFSQITPVIGPLIDSLKGFIPMIKTGVVVAFVLLATVIKLVVSIIKNVLPPIIRIVGSVLRGVVQIITGAIKVITGLFSGDFARVFSGLSDIFRGGWNIVIGIIKGAASIIWGLFTSLVSTILSVLAAGASAIFGPTSIWATMFTAARDTVARFMAEIPAFFSGMVTTIVTEVTNLYNRVTGWFMALYDRLVGHSIVPDMINAIIEWFRGLPGKISDFVRSMYDRVINKFQAMWDWLKGTFGPMWAGLKQIFTHPMDSARAVIDTIQGKVRDIFNSLWDWFSGTWIGKKWNSLKDKLIKPMQDAKQMLSDILTGKKSIKSVFEDAVTTLGKVWDGLKDKAKKPIQYIIDTVMNDGFIRVFNDFGSHLPGNPSLPKVKGFKTGGNTGPGAADKVAGIVHADEHVFTKKEVRMTPGGHKTLEAVRASIRSGEWSRSRKFDGGDDPKAALRGYMDGGAVVAGPYEKALQFAKRESGKPYIFGSAGPRGYDCSGFMAAIQNVIEGKHPYRRRYSTPAFHGGSAQGFTRGKKSPFMVGVNPAPGKSGHMAGTLLGVNVESSGGRGTHYGRGARGASNGMFSWHGGLSGGPDLGAAYDGFLKTLISKFKGLGGKWSGDNDIITKVGNAGFKQTPSKMIDYGKELVKKAVKSLLSSLGMNAKGTPSSLPGLSWVGEMGPELMNLPQGKRIHSNQKSTSMMGQNIESTMTAAFASAMSSAAKPIEQGTVDTLTRAIDRANRRVASRNGEAPRDAKPTVFKQNVYIDKMEFPNVRDATDAEDFVRALATVTPGVGGDQ
jgi:TP901 family phage tail tape measure protein